MDSGGTVAIGWCWRSGGNFSNTCLIGGCDCPPGFLNHLLYGRKVKFCRCGQGQCFDGEKCVLFGQGEHPFTDEIDDWKTYRNDDYGLELKYPKTGELVEIGGEIRINLPFDSGNILREKYLNIEIDPEEIDSGGGCFLNLPNASKIGEVRLGSISFLKKTGEEGAAGSVYHYTSYSTASDLHCIVLTFVLRSANPGNLDSPAPNFDKDKESEVFDQIISTFRFFMPEGVNLP